MTRTARFLMGHLCPDQVLGLLDLVGEVAGEFRALFRQDIGRDQFDPLPLPPMAEALEIRDLSGATLYHGRGEPRIATTAGQMQLPPPAPQARDLLAGENVLLACRSRETPAQIADWLIHHQASGASAALIVNRADPARDPHAAFATALEAVTQNLGMTILLVDPRQPLGKPDMGPEDHAFLAPDAPGKDRMTQPDPDIWYAPLGQSALYEALKWHWLGEARAVLALDICDYLAPDQGDVFTACTTAPQGVVLLAGRRAYPWRVRPQHDARIGDHICRPFDAPRGMARWGCAPKLAGLDNSWRPSRIAYRKAKSVFRFWRAMGIKHPAHSSGELVPKTALIEDGELLALSQAKGHRPVRAPKSDRRPADPAGHRTAIVTTMKNEAPFILEWLAYHRAIGVSDFLIYTNDCTDGTDSMLELLQAKGIVQHRQNPYVPGGELKPQHAALQASEAEPMMRAADWAICMDVDEFINIKIGDGRLPTLYRAMEQALPRANMISLTWRLFGNADVQAYEDRLLLDQFPLAAPEMMRKPHQAWGFKTLFRTIDLYKKIGVHRPKGLKPDLWQEVRWLNGSGRQMPPDMLRNGWRSTTETYGYDWVQLNHYAVRSAESFLVKRDRGRVNHVDRDQGLHYWFRMNHNVVEERSILARREMLQAELDRLLADPDILAAHQAAVTAHRTKIAELRATPNYEAFYHELTGDRLQNLSRLTPHFGASVFTAGPAVVPDSLALAKTLPQDFQFALSEPPPSEGEHA